MRDVVTRLEPFVGDKIERERSPVVIVSHLSTLQGDAPFFIFFLHFFIFLSSKSANARLDVDLCILIIYIHTHMHTCIHTYIHTCPGSAVSIFRRHVVEFTILEA